MGKYYSKNIKCITNNDIHADKESTSHSTTERYSYRAPLTTFHLASFPAKQGYLPPTVQWSDRMLQPHVEEACGKVPAWSLLGL